ncbi:MAG TPA: T9SS type A sorting domain-containing protein, partial [Chitinophagaceae bacterium]|nr:T9SS type A sorting domain-containing protein [Chitinophagaceae bacterium]
LNDFANSGASNPSTINNQQTSVTFTAKNLLEATAYKMRIKAEFEGQTFYSSPVFFTTTAMPAAPTITIAGQTVFCSGASAILSSSLANGNQWYKDGVAIDGATTQDYIAVNSGVYALKVTNNGCISQVSRDVNITALELPSAVISASGTTAFCEGENVILSASTAVGNTYQWQMNGNPISGAILSSHTADKTGTYTIVIASNNGCSKTSNAIDVTATANPIKPVITVTGNLLSSSAATGNQWLLNGIIIPAATNQQYNVQASGQYTVKVSHNGCSAVSDVFNFVSTAITNPSAWNNEVLIYPNPVTNKIFVTNSGGRKLRIQLIDIAGRRVFETRSSGILVTIPVKQLTSANYLVVVTDENKNETITKTIVKQ